MTTSRTTAAGPHAGLLDDAALFPPGDAAMAEAVPAHHAHRAAWYGRLVGGFVVPWVRWPELLAHLGARPVLDLTLVVAVEDLAAAVDAAAAEPRVRLTGVDLLPPAPGALRELTDHLPLAVEVPRGPGAAAVLDALGPPHRAKLRTGGTTAAAFPDERELAESIMACHVRALPFKCTAGLHRAVRHDDAATGFRHHGYLNVLLAADAAEQGATAADLARLLADRSSDRVAAAVGALAPERLRAARVRFTSFGTCSIAEPVEDLVALGLLGAPAPVAEAAG